MTVCDCSGEAGRKKWVDAAGRLAADGLRCTPKNCADFCRSWLQTAAFSKQSKVETVWAMTGVLTMPEPEMRKLYTDEFLTVISRYLRYTAGIQLTREWQLGGQAE